jgi:hypothetical protein
MIEEIVAARAMRVVHNASGAILIPPYSSFKATLNALKTNALLFLTLS